MTRVTVTHTTDAAEARAGAGAFLESDPVRHNVVLTLLTQRVRDAEPIRWWQAVDDDGAVLGAVFQSPSTFSATMSLTAPEAVGPLAAAVADTTGATLPGVMGVAAVASAFAGEYATVTRQPARPAEGQRIYELGEMVPPAGVDGQVRPADSDDLDLVTTWVKGFHADTASPRPSAPEDQARHLLADGGLLLWEVDGEPRACAASFDAEAGVGRVGFVYTPPLHRRRGYAAAVTAAVSRRVVDAGNRCILYTQLSNPVSNSVYQRLGYRPVAEVIRYAFG